MRQAFLFEPSSLPYACSSVRLEAYTAIVLRRVTTQLFAEVVIIITITISKSLQLAGCGKGWHVLINVLAPCKLAPSRSMQWAVEPKAETSCRRSPFPFGIHITHTFSRPLATCYACGDRFVCDSLRKRQRVGVKTINHF